MSEEKKEREKKLKRVDAEEALSFYTSTRPCHKRRVEHKHPDTEITALVNVCNAMCKHPISLPFLSFFIHSFHSLYFPINIFFPSWAQYGHSIGVLYCECKPVWHSIPMLRISIGPLKIKIIALQARQKKKKRAGFHWSFGKESLFTCHDVHYTL